jgi:parvulin-like peptidyl-prolyl isomerase
MKKILVSSMVALSAFAFSGMHGNMPTTKIHNMAPMKGLTDNTVVAEVYGKKVTVKEVNDYMQGMTKDFRIKLQDLPAQHVNEFVKKYVDTLTFYPKAKSITKTPQYRELMKKIAVDLWITQQFKKVKVTDKEAKEFYEKNKNIYFKTAPELKARHIVVKDEKTAKKIISILEKTPKSQIEKEFAKLAKQYSIGPSKIDGGELGYFKPSTMVKEFSDAAMKLHKGEFTKTPVKTRFGYHVILLEDKKTNVYTPFAKVKQSIIAYLKEAKLNKELDNISKEANVKYLLNK